VELNMEIMIVDNKVPLSVWLAQLCRAIATLRCAVRMQVHLSCEKKDRRIINSPVQT